MARLSLGEKILVSQEVRDSVRKERGGGILRDQSL